VLHRRGRGLTPYTTLEVRNAEWASSFAAHPSWRAVVCLEVHLDQSLPQMLQASATGLEPTHPYVRAPPRAPDGSGPLAASTTNPRAAIRERVGSDPAAGVA
jgi:hypothetical protein